MAESDDLRLFIRDIMARFDRALDAWERKTDRLAREWDIRHAREMAEFDEIRKRDAEMYAEQRAQREAFLKMFDRLDGRGDAPPATG